MNDFDYDVAQKKRIARGAYARKGTTNRKGCTLPHELLKPKELKKLNGEVKTLCLNDRLNWEEFKALSIDNQTEYLQHKLRAFGVGLNPIGTDLFGLADSVLSNYVARKGIQLQLRTGGRISKAAQESWKRWIAGGAAIAPESETADAPQVTMCEEDFKTPTTEHTTEPEVKPFRAHDFEDMFREMGMERVAGENGPSGTPTPTGEENWDLYPLTDMSLTLKGTPVDVLATLRMSFPALLDKDKTYRFTVKVDGYVL